MKKILGLAIAALLVMGLVGGGTWAYFSDTETATGNTITAGTLNLEVGSADPMTDVISISDVKPGTSATNAADWALKNTGNLPGNFWVVVGTVTESENSVTEPETQYGDVTPAAGELGSKLKIALWFDANVAGTWDTGDYYFDPTGTPSVVAWASGTTLPTAAFFTVTQFSGISWSAATGLPAMAAGFDKKFKVVYSFADSGDTTDNVAQGDGVQFNIVFNLKQS